MIIDYRNTVQSGASAVSAVSSQANCYRTNTGQKQTRPGLA